jgi:TQXA domain-containing protein
MRYKRIVSLLLVLGLVANLMSAVAFAEEENNSGEENINTSVSGEIGQDPSSYSSDLNDSSSSSSNETNTTTNEAESDNSSSVGEIASTLSSIGSTLGVASGASLSPAASDETNADTTSYVGYLYKSTGVQYKRASDGWQTSVPDIYVVSKSVYDTVLGNSKKLNESNKGTVAYCFNHSRTEPKNQADGSWVYYGGESFSSSYTFTVNDAELLYTMHPDVNGLDFRSFTDGQRHLSAEEFRAWVVSVGLNGYPNDYSGFNTDATGNQILSDDEFRAVTQLAIWHFTDDFDSADYNTWEAYYKPQSEDAQLIYSKLINTMLPESVTQQSISCLDIFDKQSGAFSNSSNFSVTNSSGTTDTSVLSDAFVSSTDSSGQAETVTDVLNYQNLLAVSTQGVPDELASLTLKKQVLDSNGAALEDLPFEFTITIKDANGNVFTPSENVIATDPTDIYRLDGMSTCFRVNSNGTVTVLLANNEALRISDLPYGYSYEISETSSRSYATTVSIDGSTPVAGTTAAETNVGSATDLSTVVTFTNQDRSQTLGSLSVGKTLSAESQDVHPDQEYTFAIDLDDPTYSCEVTDEDNQVVGTMTNGEGTISLEAGCVATLDEVLPGTEYSIQEIDLPSQTSLVSVTKETELGGQESTLTEESVSFEDNKVEGSIPSGDTSAAVAFTFENLKEADPEVSDVGQSEDPSQEPATTVTSTTSSDPETFVLAVTNDPLTCAFVLLVLVCVGGASVLGARVLHTRRN